MSADRIRRAVLATFLFLLFAIHGPTAAQEATDRHAVLIGGLGGTEEYSALFQRYLFDTRRALVEWAGFSPDQVIVLAESDEDAFVADVSTAEAIQAHFEALGSRLRPSDHVYVFLFGHGSFDGSRAYLNIPRRDLSDLDYAELLDALPAERIVFVNTASASGPFARTMSAPGRIVITATRTGTQRYETVFPRYLLEALGEAGDLDRDGNVSVREVFTYAAEQTARYFEMRGNVPTENALLEDTGDGVAYTLDALNGEGNLAAVTYFRRSDTALAYLDTDPDSPVGRMLQERERLEQDVVNLRSRKASFEEAAYYAELETLFVELARLNDRIEATTNP